MAPPCSITIPSEIITEILYRLPSKSVGRFRCVSKSWLSQLTEPHFIKTHQNTLNRNHLILSSSNHRSLYSLPFHQNHEEEEEEATLSTPTELRLDLCHNNIIVLGCCNGLVLLYCFKTKHPLVVLNPTTGESIGLPNLKHDLKGIDSGKSFMFGFGYDSVTDDYKVVAFTLLHNEYDSPTEDVFMDVYSLKNNTWKSVTYDPFHFYWGLWSSNALVNGCLHLLATAKGSNQVPLIVGFRLKDDKLSLMALPNMGIDVDVISHCRLVDLGGKLVVFVVAKGEIWLMNEYGVKESWTKIILHGFNYRPLVNPTVFDVHGKILHVRVSQMWIYNLEDGSLCKRVDTSRYLKGLIVKGVCVESLVPLPKVQSDESTDSSEG